MLAGRGDAGDALAAADAWGGDSMVTFERGDQRCVRAAFTGRTGDGTDMLAGGITRWAATMPAANATSSRAGDVVTLTACDPGAAATGPPASAVAALVVAAVRNEVLAQSVRSGVPSTVAQCIATRLVRAPAVQPVIQRAAADPAAEPSAADTGTLQRAVVELAAACAAVRR
jgi:hypothetical protein